MARTRTIRRNRKRKNTKRKKQFFLLRILPDSLQAFIARRFVDIMAMTATLAGLFVGLSLFSYNSQDPSWNTAGGEKQDIANWMGESGAFLSDILLQTLGIGAIIFSAILIIWGIRSFNRQSLRPLWLRTIALLFAAVSCSIAFSQVPSEGWITHPYMGSTLGTLVLSKIGLAGQDITPWLGPVPITIIAGILTVITGLYAAATQLAEIGYLFKNAWYLIMRTVMGIVGIGLSFSAWLRHHNDPNYRPDPLAVFKGLPKIQRPEKQEKPKRTTPTITSSPAPVVPEPAAKSAPAPTATKPAANIPVVAPQAQKQQTTDNQQRFSLTDAENWELPELTLLESPPPDMHEDQLDEKALRRNAELLQNVLADFNIEGEITSIHPGPVVTLYELEPAPGTKSAKVISLADDIARSMSAISVRVAVVPGRNVIGIELPNKNRQIVFMQELLATSLYEKTQSNLPLALGKDIGGQPILADLTKMPHLLVAGTTGSGKSVAVNTMILSLLFRLNPEKCRFIMIDPKMLELSVYDGIPHLLAPVVTEPGKAVVALKWTVAEMEERYRAMSKLGVRNIDGYNERVRTVAKNGETIMNKVQTGFDETGKPVFEDQPMDLTELPFIVVIVDEFADLMLVAGKDVENAIQRLAQMARAAGIHLIMATQRPSVDVITGVIKANFPTRISFQVTSKVDSRTILGEGGAEQLLGMGDMLYMAPGGRITRVHGPFVSDEDVEKVVSNLKMQAAPSYIESITDGDFSDASEVMQAIFDDRSSGGEKVDELYDEAVALVAREGKASTSFVQRYLQIGYNRAARIIEEMERQGVISKANATGKRDVLISDYSDAG